MENVWTTLGPEFSKKTRKIAVIVRDLYGLKSAEATFKIHLAKYMESMGYESCKADPDPLLELELRPEDGAKYYSYILCHIDYILCIHHNADSVLERLHKSFPLKQGFGKPDMYLGGKL